MVFVRLRDFAIGCFHIVGNGGTPLRGITLDNDTGFFQITQASTAALGADNGGAVVLQFGGIAFNGTCANPTLPAND